MSLSRFFLSNLRLGLKAKCILSLGSLLLGALLLLGGATYCQGMRLTTTELLATTTDNLDFAQALSIFTDAINTLGIPGEKAPC